MAKFYGNIGFFETKDNGNGVWKQQITDRPYYGDFMRQISQNQNSGNVNDDININHSISIVADPYANENYQHIRYVDINGTKWKVSSIEVQYPRLILSVGGVYNEEST